MSNVSTSHISISSSSSEGNGRLVDISSTPLAGMGGRTSAAQSAAATTTMTMTEVPSRTTTTGSNDGEVLRLTLRARNTVRWDVNVEDNEGMGKKSSKRCCIFHKQRNFGESSSDSSATENNHSDDDSDNVDDAKPRATNDQRGRIARPKTKSKDVPDYQRFHA
jgi:protein phosphatase 1 regulatory subunit 11